MVGPTSPEHEHRRKPVLFLVLVPAASTPFWLASQLLPRAEELPLPPSALMAVVPGLVAVALTGRQAGRRGVRRLLRQAVDVGRVRPPAAWAPLALTMPALTALSYALARAYDRPLPEPDIRPVAVAATVVVFLVSGTCEQLGWTGYLQEPLEDRLGFLGAALTTGVAWALWHVIPYLQMGRDGRWMVGQLAFTVVFRVLIATLAGLAGGGVAAATAIQASSNVAWLAFPNGGSHYDPALMAVLTALTTTGLLRVRGRRIKRGPGAGQSRKVRAR